jgi:LCP family protein required for cell wall assembly
MMDSINDYQQGVKNSSGNKRKKWWLKPLLSILAIIILIGGFFVWKTGAILNKVSTNGNIFGSLTRMIPGREDKLNGEEKGRINVLLLGMRGENVPGGGTLADTIMIASLNFQENKISFLSVPRDLYVDNPALNAKSKINAVYAYGQQQGKGIEDMKKVISDVVGAPIHYALVINFKGFTDLVDAVGGVDITLEKPFEEAMQFDEERVCDSYTFTKPTGRFENKYYTRTEGTKYLAKSYPLCTNPNTECGGDFKLPAGKQILTGEQALCYARARKTSSDFARAKRQQYVIQQIKEKALAMGTLTDFSKVNDMLNSLGNNVKTDLQGWEMKRLFELEQKMQSPQIVQHVLENSPEGLLYTPQSTPEAGYILAPIGDNYDKIHDLFQNIFARPSQSDAKPE